MSEKRPLTPGCVICLKQVESTEPSFQCKEGHVQCEECFLTNLLVFCEPGGQFSSSVQKNGRESAAGQFPCVLFSTGECAEGALDERDLVRRLSHHPAAYEAFRRAQDRNAAESAIRAIREDEEKQKKIESEASLLEKTKARVIEAMQDAQMVICPNCHHKWSKDDKCVHVTCKTCKTDFCYWCGQRRRGNNCDGCPHGSRAFMHERPGWGNFARGNETPSQGAMATFHWHKMRKAVYAIRDSLPPGVWTALKAAYPDLLTNVMPHGRHIPWDAGDEPVAEDPNFPRFMECVLFLRKNGDEPRFGRIVRTDDDNSYMVYFQEFHGVPTLPIHRDALIAVNDQEVWHNLKGRLSPALPAGFRQGQRLYWNGDPEEEMRLLSLRKLRGRSCELVGPGIEGQVRVTFAEFPGKIFGVPLNLLTTAPMVINVPEDSVPITLPPPPPPPVSAQSAGPPTVNHDFNYTGAIYQVKQQIYITLSVRTRRTLNSGTVLPIPAEKPNSHPKTPVSVEEAFPVGSWVFLVNNLGPSTPDIPESILQRCRGAVGQVVEIVSRRLRLRFSGPDVPEETREILWALRYAVRHPTINLSQFPKGCTVRLTSDRAQLERENRGRCTEGLRLSSGLNGTVSRFHDSGDVLVKFPGYAYVIRVNPASLSLM